MFVVGNWKCNPGSSKKAEKLFSSINKNIQGNKLKVVICPPFVFIPHDNNFNFDLGAQNCFFEEGAFTGEVSVSMLKDLGCKYVIIGHSERRKLFNEEKNIGKKVNACLEKELIPILCIDKISQLEDNLKKVKDKSKVIIAFEPLSAIGSGKPFDSEKAKDMNLKIQNTFKEKQTILYGGSIDSNNVLDFVGKDKFDGVLVGGASLDSEEFVKIIEKVESLK